MKNFLLSPETPTTGIVLLHTVPNSSPLQYSLFLPPGTFRLVGTYTSGGDLGDFAREIKGVWRRDRVPVTPAYSTARTVLLSKSSLKLLRHYTHSTSAIAKNADHEAASSLRR